MHWSGIRGALKVDFQVVCVVLAVRHTRSQYLAGLGTRCVCSDSIRELCNVFDEKQRKCLCEGISALRPISLHMRHDSIDAQNMCDLTSRLLITASSHSAPPTSYQPLLAGLPNCPSRPLPIFPNIRFVSASPTQLGPME
jgi:hypothetical protein